MIRIALWVFVSVVGAVALGGHADFGGLPAARALQAWWMARQFESAALHDDLDGLARLGPGLASVGAGDGPLRFAANRIGFQATGESWELPAAEARQRAEQGLSLLEAALGTSSDPFEIRLTQALILVNRVEEAGDARRLQVAEEWIAAGGGPRYPFSTPAESYREALRRPAPERSTFLTARFRIAHAEPH